MHSKGKLYIGTNSLRLWMSTGELPRSVKIILIIIVIVILTIPPVLYTIVMKTGHIRISAFEARAIADQIVKEKGIPLPLVYIEAKYLDDRGRDVDKYGNSLCWSVVYGGNNTAINGISWFNIDVYGEKDTYCYWYNESNCLGYCPPLEGDMMDSGHAYDIITNNKTVQSFMSTHSGPHLYLSKFKLEWWILNLTCEGGQYKILHSDPTWTFTFVYPVDYDSNDGIYGGIDALNGTWVWGPFESLS
jgi:hypothetical protein